MACTMNNQKSCISESVQVSPTRWQDYFFKSTSKLNLVGPTAPPSGSRKWQWIILAVLAIGVLSFIGAFFALNRVHRGSLKGLYAEMSSNINEKIDPCDDFYEFACGSFAERHVVPKDQAEISYFTLETDRVKKEIMDKLDGPSLTQKSKPLQYIKRIWDSCVNDKSITSTRLTDLMEYFQVLDSLKNWQERFAKVTKDGYNVFFTLDVEDDPKWSYTKLVSIDKPHLPFAGLISREASGSSGLSIFYAQLLSMAKNNQRWINYYDIAHHVIEFESWIMNYSTPELVRLRNPNAFNQKTSYQFLEKMEAMDWKDILYVVFNKTFSSWDNIVVHDLEYFESFAKIVERKNDSFLTDYIKMAVIRDNCFILGDQCRSSLGLLLNSTNPSLMLNFEKEMCFNTISEHLEELLMKVYATDSYWTNEYSMTKMAGNLMFQLEDLIQNMKWMDNDTMTAALAKVRSLKYNVEVKLPYWLDYDPYLEQNFIQAPHINDTHKELDMFTLWRDVVEFMLANKRLGLTNFIWSRESWPLSLFHNRPKYMQKGKLYVPAMMIKGHFYDENYPTALKFGLLGTLMGHAMTHSVDGVANKHENEVAQRNFWTQKTTDNFNSQMQCLVEAYQSEKINIDVPGAWVNGNSTLDENLADLIGLELAYQAYKNISLSIKETKYPDPFNSYTDDQMFFMSYANVHCNSDNYQTLLNLMVGTHSPRKHKVNVPLKQMRQFANAFACSPSSKMNPVTKCSIK